MMAIHIPIKLLSLVVFLLIIPQKVVKMFVISILSHFTAKNKTKSRINNKSVFKFWHGNHSRSQPVDTNARQRHVTAVSSIKEDFDESVSNMASLLNDSRNMDLDTVQSEGFLEEFSRPSLDLNDNFLLGKCFILSSRAGLHLTKALFSVC